MLVSWNWLNDYVALSMPHDELVERLTMSGLNHESTEAVGDDRRIDLEVTSNRPDCLGHLGIAREIAALFKLDLKTPAPQLKESDTPVDEALQVAVEVPQLCSRYSARVVRGVRIGPSPAWLQQRLAAVGIASVNNVVDATNYVMLECGQPLHAFDYRALRGERIIVRHPRGKESLTAIDHRNYLLGDGDCVIADAERPTAIGGVMGGEDSEITSQTRDVVLESAHFAPLAIRNTARRLNLHSPSSFRFERGVDWHQIDWASRRCCQLIVELAGGEVLRGALDVGEPPAANKPIHLRNQRIAQVLGIEIPRAFICDLLPRLGARMEARASDWMVTPPSWRRDLQREIDLIEEVGRTYGYHHIPDDVPVPLSTSQRTLRHRVLDRVRRVAIAAGFDEAMTASMVPEAWAELFSPWTPTLPLQSSQPMLGVLEKASQNVGPVNCLRRSLVPSLLESRRINEYRSNQEIELFETAHVYLPDNEGLPRETLMLCLVSERDYFVIKGVLEAVVHEIAPAASLQFRAADATLLDRSRSAVIESDGQLVGVVGVVTASGRKQMGIRRDAVIAELDLNWLERHAQLIAKHQPISEFPAVSRDFNFVVADRIAWNDLATLVKEFAGPHLAAVEYRETFRDPNRDGDGRKRLLLSVQWRSHRETLTNQVVDQAAEQIIRECGSRLDAQLVS